MPTPGISTSLESQYLHEHPGLQARNLFSPEVYEALTAENLSSAINKRAGTSLQPIASHHNRVKSDPLPNPLLSSVALALNKDKREQDETVAEGERTPGGTVLTREKIDELTKTVKDAVENYTVDNGPVKSQKSLDKFTNLNVESQEVKPYFEQIQIRDYFKSEEGRDTDTINSELVATLAARISAFLTKENSQSFKSALERIVLVASFNEGSAPLLSLAAQADKIQKFQVGLKGALEKCGVLLGAIKVTSGELESAELFNAMNDCIANQKTSSSEVNALKPLVYLLMPNIMLEPELSRGEIISKLSNIFAAGYEPKESEKFDAEKVFSLNVPAIDSKNSESLSSSNLREILSGRAEKFFANCCVVKLGSKQLEKNNIPMLMAACSRLLRLYNIRLAVVASGAVMHGRNIKDADKAQWANLSKPATAAIGQPVLDELLTTYAAKVDMSVVQLLLSPWHLANEQQRKRIASMIMSLMDEGKLPLINGNDVTGLPGGNDEIAVLIANLIGASVILTTDVAGMYQDFGTLVAKLIQQISTENAKKMGCAKGSQTSEGTGGVKTKLVSAEIRNAPPPQDKVYIVEGNFNKSTEDTTRMEKLVRVITEICEVLERGHEPNSDLLEKLNAIPHTAIHTNPNVETKFFESPSSVDAKPLLL